MLKELRIEYEDGTKYTKMSKSSAKQRAEQLLGWINWIKARATKKK